MHLAAPREKNPVSWHKNCHISGTTGDFFKILLFFAVRECHVDRTVWISESDLNYIQSESQKTGKLETFAKVPILDEFSQNFQESWLSKPSDQLEISRKIKPETPKKILKKKKTKKSSKIGACSLMFFRIGRGKEYVDKFRENVHISITNANFLKILVSAVV